VAANPLPDTRVGVDEWQRQNPRKSVTDFVIEAAMTKLDAEGIAYDRAGAVFDGRRRVPEVMPFIALAPEPRLWAMNEAPAATAAVEKSPEKLVAAIAFDEVTLRAQTAGRKQPTRPPRPDAAPGSKKPRLKGARS